MKRITFILVLAAIFASCATTHITTEQRTSSYTYKNKNGMFRVTHTYIRKVDTLTIKNNFGDEVK